MTRTLCGRTCHQEMSPCSRWCDSKGRRCTRPVRVIRGTSPQPASDRGLRGLVPVVAMQTRHGRPYAIYHTSFYSSCAQCLVSDRHRCCLEHHSRCSSSSSSLRMEPANCRRLGWPARPRMLNRPVRCRGPGQVEAVAALAAVAMGRRGVRPSLPLAAASMPPSPWSPPVADPGPQVSTPVTARCQYHPGPHRAPTPVTTGRHRHRGPHRQLATASRRPRPQHRQQPQPQGQVHCGSSRPQSRG